MFELRLQLYGTQRVTYSDPPMGTKDGRPFARITVPAGGVVVLTYLVE